MESYDTTGPAKPGAGIHIEGFPNAVAVIGLTGPKPTRLSQLSLHFDDLLFAKSCLDALAHTTDEPMKSALWFTAINTVVKCFSKSKSRFSLSKKHVLHGEPAVAIEAFDFFHAMRNKHYAHDENAYLQSLPAAIINEKDDPDKIAKIVTLSFRADILGQENFNNLNLLVEASLKWVTEQYDAICVQLTEQLEQIDHATLLAYPHVEYAKPTLDDTAKSRNHRT
jgi:hypothetical protein